MKKPVRSQYSVILYKHVITYCMRYMCTRTASTSMRIEDHAIPLQTECFNKMYDVRSSYPFGSEGWGSRRCPWTFWPRRSPNSPRPLSSRPKTRNRHGTYHDHSDDGRRVERPRNGGGWPQRPKTPPSAQPVGRLHARPSAVDHRQRVRPVHWRDRRTAVDWRRQRDHLGHISRDRSRQIVEFGYSVFDFETWNEGGVPDSCASNGSPVAGDV